jgi:hypothetical protein
MKIIKLEKKEDFLNLKKGHFILVKWSDYYYEHTPNCSRVAVYKILEIKEKNNNIICKLPENHYFNWDEYLKGKSVAKEVYLVNINSSEKETKSEMEFRLSF